ncbi:hypothetical protein GCM10011533_11410 [Streptosporangium jomthongense]|nr:hypothetical protein GCM10011533_11410 [Streptosporangium jomthongense]
MKTGCFAKVTGQPGVYAVRFLTHPYPAGCSAITITPIPGWRSGQTGNFRKHATTL